MNQLSKLPFKIFLVAGFALAFISAARAEDNELQLAMDNYRKHDWEEALSHLGAALPSEFNNANLHYHMANCMVHMRQKESAIREYRIAYALDPHGRIGNYCKQCLKLFGIDAAGLLPMPEAPQKIERSKDVETLAKRDGPETTKDSKDAKDGKDIKDSRDTKDPSLAKVAKFVTEEDRVRQNLADLIQSKPRPGSAKLQEIGTNVFVRNYKDPLHTEKTSAANPQPKPGEKSTANPQQKPGEKSSANPQQKPGAKSSANPQQKAGEKAVTTSVNSSAKSK
ncbi:MAG TPA: hypothetical protein V6C89_03995 [Drouetiella sp.]|jgi:hypothetical protein